MNGVDAVPFEVLIQMRLDRASLHGAATAAVAAEVNSSRVELSGCDRDLLDLENSQTAMTGGAPRMPWTPLPCAALSMDRFADGHLADPDPKCRLEALLRLMRIIRIAGKLGIPRISVAPAAVASEHPRRVDYQEALNRTADAMDEVAGLAERCGVRICLRAAKHGFLTSPPELREFLDAVNSPVFGVDLDFAARCDSASWMDWFRTLESRIWALGIEIDPVGTVGSPKSQLRMLQGDLRQFSRVPSIMRSVVLRRADQ